jgi:hypothetical protein
VRNINKGNEQSGFELKYFIHYRIYILYTIYVKLSLCLTKHHYIKTYWGVKVELHAFLTSELDGGEWSASRSGHFTLKERAPGINWI